MSCKEYLTCDSRCDEREGESVNCCSCGIEVAGIMRKHSKVFEKLQNVCISEYIWKDKPKSMTVAYVKYIHLLNNFLSTTE
jgi:hypothetical protein